jgi:signal transduction histidine kinase
MPSINLDWLVPALGPGASTVEAAAEMLGATAWFAIFALLITVAVKRRNFLSSGMLLMAGAATLLGAVAALLPAASSWLPIGFLAGPVGSAASAFLALVAAGLWLRLPRLLAVPTATELEAAKIRLEVEIRERIAAQAERRALEAGFEARVAARTAAFARENAELLAEIAEKHELATELARARDQAEGANRVKSMFLASMSHDLRTPLNAIIGFSEMMMQEVRGPLGHPKYRGYIEDIHRSGHLLLSLINNILDLSKIEAGKHELVLSMVDGKQVARECIGLIAGQSGFADVEPAIVVHGDGLLYADELALRQIIMNLVGNAAKFTPAGGQITIGVGRSIDGGGTVTVTDSGIGMDEKGLRKALEPFGQATLTAKPRGSGSGLGLTIVTRLVEAHGGRFAIDSAPGYGTTVRIWLPSHPAEQPAVSVPVAARRLA